MAEGKRSVGGYVVPLTDDDHKNNSLIASRIAKLLKNRKAKGMLLKEVDRLSALPDSLLLHILSPLGIRDVVRTGVLSSRWQYLWMDSSQFNFCYDGRKITDIRDFVDWVGKTIRIYGGTHWNKVVVSFKYRTDFALSVDVWVEFLIKNKVKDVSLDLSSYYKDSYELPEMMYSNSSLTNLSLQNCRIAPPPGSIEWKSLTSLSIGEAEFNESMIDSILMGCPVLESLKLTKCFTWSTIVKMDINTPSLKKVVIENLQDFGLLKLEIFAPYIQHLSIYGSERRCPKYRLIRISSLVTANLGFHIGQMPLVDGAISEQEIGLMKELFECLQHVKELELGTWFVEALAVLVLRGWQLPHYSCTCLTFDAVRNLWSIPGILCMLESSPNLERFVINGIGNAKEASETLNPPASYLEKGDLDCDLLHLKTIEIKGFRGPYLAREPMLKLVQLLLKRAKVLEKMVISVKSSRTSSDFIKISLALHSYPRSSPKAAIFVSLNDRAILASTLLLLLLTL